MDRSLPGVNCGPLAPGSELSFRLTAQPRDAGNFTFKFNVGDGGEPLGEADGEIYVYIWRQTIVG